MPGENSGSGKTTTTRTSTTTANVRESRIPVSPSKTVNANIREDRIPNKTITTTSYKPEVINPVRAFKPEIINPVIVSEPTFQYAPPTPFTNDSVQPTPVTPTTQVVVSPPPPPIKTATPDIVLFDEDTVDVDEMFDLIFENLGGQELINITRSDIVNGQKISYQPIKNLSNIQQRYNPNNIISLQQTADKYFAGFSIKLENKIPNEGNGPNGENIYIDTNTGDLIIEFVNLNNDEQIQVEITLDGTIYEVNLGDYASW